MCDGTKYLVSHLTVTLCEKGVMRHVTYLLYGHTL